MIRPHAPATRVVFAPDGFKGTLDAVGAARALAEGWRAVDPAVDAVLRPMADGGEGTLAAFEGAVAGARRVPVEVCAPAPGMPRVAASWLWLPPEQSEPGAVPPGSTGVVELGSTAGIELFGDRRDPWRASTRGFGEAIRAALDAGVSRLVLAIGSSASTDGGAGMLLALGARFAGVAPDAAPGAADLPAIVSADLSGLRPLPSGGAVVLGDVDSPLLGARGAAAVFGPQKGFAADELDAADAGLAAFAALLPADPAAVGAGAAGGTGFALLAWGATRASGAAAVAELVGVGEAALDADLVVTGEGSYDAQSAHGKAPAVVAALATASATPVALVAGRIAAEADTSAFTVALSLTALAGSSRDAMADPGRWLRAAGEELARRHAAR